MNCSSSCERRRVIIDQSPGGGGGTRESNNPVLIQCGEGVKDDHIVRRVKGFKGVKVKVATIWRDGTDRKRPRGTPPLAQALGSPQDNANGFLPKNTTFLIENQVFGKEQGKVAAKMILLVDSFGLTQFEVFLLNNVQTTVQPHWIRFSEWLHCLDQLGRHMHGDKLERRLNVESMASSQKLPCDDVTSNVHKVGSLPGPLFT